MKKSKRVKLSRGFAVATSVAEITIGGLAMGFHIKDMIDNKSVDPMKDPIKMGAFGGLIGAGVGQIIDLAKSHKDAKLYCEELDKMEETSAETSEES